MSNTLETKTFEQLYMAIKSYNSFMCEIPKQFIVRNEYLYGITEEEFCEAFHKLQDIVMKIYDDLLVNPQVIGLATIDLNTGTLNVQNSQHISCIKKLLYSLGLVAEINEHELFIKMDSFMDAYATFLPNCSTALSENIIESSHDKRKKIYQTKQVALLLQYLTKFGFEIENIHVNKPYNEIRDFTVSYPKMPNVITVIKAFSMPRICRISFGFDYTKFNYRVFAHPSDVAIPYLDLYSIQLLPDIHKEFFIKLNQCMNDLGINFGECESGWYHGVLPCQYIYNKKLRLLQNMEYGLMPAVVVKVGKKIDKITKFIEKLPEEYKAGIGNCHGCRTEECTGRTIIIIDDRKYVLCNGSWWMFPVTIQAIPYIIEAYKL